ncbi:MAG: GTP-binding protein [Clostridia bacterium]|nr:GTP-binding protein [Clostridia bacterium]MBR2313208.1 GTP-binding protein [Clostridia bacterium]
MTKIDIFSGFLGAGKTTLIKKLISEAYVGERLVLIENEFGEIGIDGGFLADAGIVVNEMNSGCICCSLVGDFGEALKKVLTEYAPDRILIEPSGVGKLSDVVRAIKEIGADDLVLSGTVTVADAKKCRMHMRNFGEFFNDQIANADTIVLSHTKGLSEEQLHAATEALREHNDRAVIVTTDWAELTGAQLLAAIAGTDTLAAELARLQAEELCPTCGHPHHHHHDEECHCHEHKHHHHGEECHCHEHEHHHHHDEECCCHEHEHHHHHDEECCCHEHGHHHHADEVFVSYGAETAKRYDKDALLKALSALDDAKTYGTVLRAKGIVAGEDGKWLHFDYVPGEGDVREGSAAIIGRLCVIGSALNKAALSDLLGVTLK